MMRISYSEDEDHPGQFNLWHANCERSLRSKLGQQELRELRAALLALSDKRLIHGLLTDEDGGVCAIGAYARRKGLDLSQFDPEDLTDEVGIAAGMPKLVAWKVVEMNDMEMHSRFTPEERYTAVLAWVESKLSTRPPDEAGDVILTVE
jgi:hypothetical protein